MILPYRDEIDLRMTKYGDNWKSPYLADNPIYTDELQRIDRWCRRRYELGRRQELNEAYKQSNDKEKRRRRQHNDCLNSRMSDVFGDEYAGKKIFNDENVHFTNEGFDPDWMDADIIEHDLPVIELMKEWLILSGAVAARNERKKIEEQIQAENILEYIKYYEKQERKLQAISGSRQKRNKRSMRLFHRKSSNKGTSKWYWLNK